MTPEMHQRVRKLFDEVMERAEGDRIAYLHIACDGDDEVYEAVVRLLEASKPAQSFLATKARAMEKIGRYMISGELGRGGMGVVYEAVDPLIDRKVAVKVIHVTDLVDASEAQFLRERLFREARSAGQLFHPSIVTVLDVGQEGELAFIAMERVDGISLQKALSSGVKLDQKQILDILRQTASALDFAHRNKIIHCDVKPGNIILDRSGVVKLTDFGIAKISSAQYHTRTGMVMGTPSYMSPEQIEGRTLDGRSDQFSLAVVAFELVTGAVPFRGDSIVALAHSIVYGARPSARTLNPSLPPAVDAVIERALATPPDNRFPTCADFVKELDMALRGVPQAPPLSVPQTAERPPVVPVVTAPAPVPVLPTAPLPPTVPAPVVVNVVPAPPAPRGNTWAIMIAVVAVVALAAGALYQFKLRPTAQPAPVPVTSAAPTTAPGPVSSPVSPARPVQPPAQASVQATTPAATPATPVAPPTPSSSQPPQSQPPPPVPPAAPPSDQPALLAPVVAQFMADPASIPSGSTATLHWDVKRAVKVTIDPDLGVVQATGSAKVKPQATTVYRLTAVGLGGQTTEQTRVAVADGPSAGTLYSMAATEKKAGHRDKASALFHQSADLGEVRSMLELGKMASEDGAGQDYGDAMRWFRMAADKGNSQSMLLLGTMYYLAKGVPHDYAAAANWFQKASDAGEAAAKYDLGTMYESGLGVTRDLDKAKQFYQDAARLGNQDASKKLAAGVGK